MALSSELIDQLVKVTQNTEPRDKDNTAYGTVVIMGSKKYVKIDGSDLMTPVSSTVAVENGDRVIVTIKSHSATVTGNTSSPAASDKKVTELGTKISDFEIVIADKVSAKELDVQIGRIDDLTADNVIIKESLTANKASIDDLTAKNAEITGTLEANKAKIDDLDAKKLDAEVADIKYASVDKLEATDANLRNLKSDYAQFEKTTTGELEATNAKIDGLDTKYANVDFSNIGKAAIEHFYATSGIIKDLVIGDQTITGELVGVTITGDLIKGNTIVADKLVIKGSDGLYYKLNTDGVTTEKEQTEYNSLNGQIIQAKSITATKIDVKDLVAFGATIGGFNIGQDSIFSGVKETVDNKTRGIYMDKNGQIAIGDVNNYIKYFKDTDGKYRLKISAASLEFNASGDSGEESKDLETVIKDINSRVDGIAETNKGIGSITNYYLATSESSGVTTETAGWTTKIQNVSSSKKYLWNYEVTKYTDDTIANTTEPCIIGMYSAVGATGNGIQKITEYYALSALKDSVPTVWSENVPNLTATNKYLWNYEEILYTNGGTELTKKRIIGVYGDTGKDGAKGEDGFSPTATISKDGDTTTITIVDKTGTHTQTVKDGTNGTPGKDGTNGKTTYFHVKYSNDGGKTFTSNNGETVGSYIGTCTNYTEADPTAVGSYVWAKIKGEKGDTGAKGVGVSNVDVMYYKSTSATSLSGGSWVTTDPGWENGKYIWSKTIITYTDKTIDESTPVCITGAKGSTGGTGAKGETGADGKGISSIVEQYYQSTSSTSLSGGSWSEKYPGWVNGKYIWTRSVITYTDKTTTTTTAVCITGAKGSTGNDGKSIGSVINYYLATASSSGVTTSTSGWTTTVQNVTLEKKYLWNYEVVKYSDGTVASTTAPCIIGTYGDTGKTGATGAQGYSIVTNITRDNRAEADWEKYSALGYVTDLSGTQDQRNGCRVGDIFTVTGTATDTKNGHVAYYRSDTASGQLHGPCISHTVIPRGETGNNALQVLKQWNGTYTTIGQETNCATDRFNRTPVVGDMFTNVDASSNLGTWQITKVADGQAYFKMVSYVSAKGATGATGNGIKSIKEHYAVSSSNTVTPTTWFDDVPVTNPVNKYLWNYETITYTNGTSVDSNKRVIGVYGDTGKDGAKGEKGDDFNWNLVKGSSMTNGVKLQYDCLDWMNSVISAKYTDDGLHLITPSEGNANNGVGFKYDNYKNLGINTGDTITFSCDVKGTCDSNNPFLAIHFQRNGTTWYDSGSLTSPQTNFIPESTFKRVSVTYTLPASLEGKSTAVWFAIHGNYQSDLYIRNVKIELGSTATAWSPHPDDLIGETGLSMIVLQTVYSYYQTELDKYATSGYNGTWTVTSSTGVKTGDTVYLKVKNATKNGDSYIISKVNSIPSTTSVNCTSIGLLDKGDIGATGADGKGIKSTAITYQASTSGTTIPTGTWQTTIPTVSAGQYLWTRTVITYTDNATSTSYSVGRMGTNGTNGSAGKGIKSTAITYQAGSSGTTAPTGTWQTSIPATSASSPYLWTRTIITYTDNTTSTSYAVGSTLEGVSVGGRNLLPKTHKTAITYTYPTGTSYADSWRSITTVPLNGDTYTLSFWAKSTVDGDKIIVHFWNPSNIISGKSSQGVTTTASDGRCPFTLSTTLTKYWVTYKIPAGGNSTRNVIVPRLYGPDRTESEKGTGKITVQWEKLEEGNIATDWTPAPEDSIASVDVEYYLSTSATALSGGSWSTTAPTWVNGKYMWSRTVTVDGSGNKTYSPNQNGVCIAGAKGETGNTALTFKKNFNGTYTTAGVETNALLTSFNRTPVVGDIFTNIDGSSNTGTWEIIKIENDRAYFKLLSYVSSKGATGNTGATGKGVSSIIEQYYKSTSATVLSGGSWVTTYPGWESGKYIWTRSVITYTDNTTVTTTAVCVTGEKGQIGNTGAAGKDATYITVSGSNYDTGVNNINAVYILINGTKYNFTAGRGHTLAIVNPANGSVESIKTYDTYTDATLLESPLSAVASGKIICLFSQDATQLNQKVRNILISCGSARTDTWGAARITHVFIGMKGLAKGNAYETTATGSDGIRSVTAYYTPSGIVLNGATGTTGATGATGKNALQPKRNWNGTFTTIGDITKPNVNDFNRTPVVGDVFINLDGSSNTGTWKVTAVASNGEVTCLLLSYVNSKGDKGDTGATGATGPKGDTGERGATGDNLITVNAGNPRSNFGGLQEYGVYNDPWGTPCVKYPGKSTQPYLMLTDYTPFAFRHDDRLYYDLIVPNYSATTFGARVYIWFYDANKAYVDAIMSESELVLTAHQWNSCKGFITITKTNLQSVRYYVIGIENPNKYEIGICNGSYIERVYTYAAKTATNFMEFTSGTGLQIGDKTNGTWKGFRSRITSEAFEILNEVGTAVASYGRKLIQLGKDSTDAVIELCGGKGKISFTNRQSSTSWSSDKDLDDLTLTSESIRLDGHDVALNTTNEGILDSIAEDKTAHAYTRLWSSIDKDSIRPNAGFNVTVDSYYGQVNSRFAMQSEAYTKTTSIVMQAAYTDSRGQSTKVEVKPDALYINNKSFLDRTYPVGSIYLSVNNTNPTNLFGGTWVAWGAGRVPVGFNSGDGNFNSSEKTGGSKTINISHSHTVNSHAHVGTVGYDENNYYTSNVFGNTVRSYNGYWFHARESGATNPVRLSYTSSETPGTNPKLSTTQSILQPYITCYMWKRTA